MHENCARVAAAARARGLAIEIVELTPSTRSAEEAARAIGCGVEHIVKSLCFVAGERPVLALVGGANRLDERLLAAAAGVGAKEVRRADPELVRAATGFAIGGVAPFGHPAPLATFVDADLCSFETVWAAAGTPHAVFAVTPADLVRATGGAVVPLARAK